MFPLLSRLLVKQMISMSSSVIFSFTMCLCRNIRKLRELVSGLVIPWFIQVHLDLYWNRVCMQQLPWRKIISSFVYFFFFSHCLPRWFLLYISSKKTFPRSSPGFWWVGGFMLCSASGFYCDLKTNGKKGQDSYISNICFTKFGVLKICESQVFK